MSLKLLIIPFLIIMSLILSIGYIKGDIVLLLDKMNELTLRKTERNDVDRIQNLIVNMKNELAAEDEKTAFLGDYLPDWSDQERAIDAMNYLASRTGMLLTSVDVEEIKEVPVEIEPEPAVASSLDSTGASLEGAVLLPQPKKFVPAKYTVTVDAVGSYRSTRDYLTQITRSNRFVRLKTIGLGVPETKESQGGQPAPGTVDLLEANFVAEFDYLRPVQIDNAMTYRYIFDSDSSLKRSVSAVGEIMASLKAEIPKLVIPEDAGRENPFVK